MKNNKEENIMKAIIMNLKNKVRIEKEFDEIQRRSQVRTTSFDEVMEIVNNYQKNINVSKRLLEGTKLVVNTNAQVFPNSYKYIPISTIVELKMDKRNWKIIDIRRDICNNKTITATLSETAKEKIIYNMEHVTHVGSNFIW